MKTPSPVSFFNSRLLNVQHLDWDICSEASSLVLPCRCILTSGPSTRAHPSVAPFFTIQSHSPLCNCITTQMTWTLYWSKEKPLSTHLPSLKIHVTGTERRVHVRAICSIFWRKKYRLDPGQAEVIISQWFFKNSTPDLTATWDGSGRGGRRAGCVFYLWPLDKLSEKYREISRIIVTGGHTL
jgi:hypothetical protein